MSLGSAILNQCRKPSGWLGRFNLWSMNRRHARVTEWGLSHIQVRSADTVLDIGCGGGMTLRRLAAMAHDGKVYGVDFSDTSVAASRRTNASAIDKGRVNVQQASVSKLPFPDSTFDVVTAVETHYYWPDLEADMREVLRVLKPGGTFIVIAEAYKGGKYDALLRRMENVRRYMSYAHLTIAEHTELLSKAGFSDVQPFEQWEKGWMCVTGRRALPR